MILSSSIMQILFAVVWFCIIVNAGKARGQNEESTTSIYWSLELQDSDSADNASTGVTFDIEENKTLHPPSLKNDTNINYVKNISEDEMAEVEYSTYTSIEIPTVIPTLNLDMLNETSEIESDIDILIGHEKMNLSFVEKNTSDLNLTDNDIDITTVETVMKTMTDGIEEDGTHLFQDQVISDNVIMDRMGIAIDYADEYPDEEKAKSSSWKPVWPYAASPSFKSTPLIESDPRTVLSNVGTIVKPVGKTDKTVIKEPITAYYFDVNNSPLPAVGPLHDPSDIYGLQGYNTSKEQIETQYSSNITEYLLNQDSVSLTNAEEHIIESTPVVRFNSIQEESSKLSGDVYSILNDGFDQDREEISVTFSTLLPPLKDTTLTKTIEKLHPKRVTINSKESVTNAASDVQSSIMDISSSNISHEGTKILNSSPMHVSVTPTIYDLKTNKTRTPLWVRLSGQSKSLANFTKTKTADFHTIIKANAPSPTSTSNPLTNYFSSTHPPSKTILPNSIHAINNQSIGIMNQQKKHEINGLNSFHGITTLESPIILLNNSVETSFSTSNSSSISHSTHSTSNSTTNVSISEKEKSPDNDTKADNDDEHFNLKSPMTDANIYKVPLTTVITPTTLQMENFNMSTDTSALFNKSQDSIVSTYGDLPPSDMEEQSSIDSIIEDQIVNLDKVNINKTNTTIEQEKNYINEYFSRNLTRTVEETSQDSMYPPMTTEKINTDSLKPDNSLNIDGHHDITEQPIAKTTKLQAEGGELEREHNGVEGSMNYTLPNFTPTSTIKEILDPNPTENTIFNMDVEHDDAPGQMVLPPTKIPFTTDSDDRAGLGTWPPILSDDGNMIKTVIKHFPGKQEPVLKVVEMHSNGENFTKSSPYLKAALSYGVREFCRHQGNIRSLLAEWINSHLKNETDSYSYEVQFFAQPNCSNLTQHPEDNAKSKTVLYFYVMNEGRISPNVTRQYPKNPTNLEISQKLAYLKQKILHLELVNAISSSEDLALEEAAVGTSILAIIISTIILFFVVISAALVFIIVKRRRANDQSHGRRCTPAANDTYSMDSVSVFYHSFKRKSRKRASNKSLRSYLNQGFDDPNGPSRQLNFGKLTHFISDTEGIYDEFLKIPSVTPKYDEMPRGVEDKNRYANVIPVPETRVLLKAKVQTPVEEYINANYVHGARGEAKYYIAAQAPLDDTVADFWQMIWEHESKVIVMLTDFVEKGIDKCADYLPPSETLDCHRVYGDFQVTLKSRDMREKYVVSQVQLKNLENNLVREIAHMWFTGWPYSGIPNEEKSFISYIFETRAMRKKLRSKGPIIVHCSPGTGRSGTFIACDISMRNFDDQKSVDIPKTVWRIRRERAGAVQTKEQYSFIYRVTNLYAAKLMTGNLDLF